jgi:hypothetical protein
VNRSDRQREIIRRCRDAKSGGAGITHQEIAEANERAKCWADKLNARARQAAAKSAPGSKEVR